MRRGPLLTLVLLLPLLAAGGSGLAQPGQPGGADTGGAGTAGAGAMSANPRPGTPQITGAEIAGVTYVDAGALATALGDVVRAAGGVLTWRGSEGVATFFLGSADALLQKPLTGGPDDWALSAPPLLKAGSSGAEASGWLLPLDAVQLLGVAASEVAEQVYLHLPGGVMAVLVPAPSGGPDADSGDLPGTPDVGPGSSEVTAVAGVTALRFFVDDDLSLLVLDLDMAPLAYPELTAVVDAAAAKAGGDQALLALVTSLRQRDWSTSLVFEQDALVVEVRSPYRFHLFLGAGSTVSPQAPVAGVILLPPAFSLYKPITVSWAGQTATVTFRR